MQKLCSTTPSQSLIFYSFFVIAFADLMLPGIYRGGCEEDILKTLKKDEICAVGLVGQRYV